MLNDFEPSKASESKQEIVLCFVNGLLKFDQSECKVYCLVNLIMENCVTEGSRSE